MKERGLCDKVYKIRVLKPLGDTDEMGETERLKQASWNKQIPLFATMFPDLVYLNGISEDKVIGLTFDDAPDVRYTPLILDVLKNYGIKASFFVHGNRAKRLKGLVKRMAAEGHYVGGHTCTHPNLTTISTDEVINEVVKSCKMIEKITGHNPKIIRPPYGEIDLRVIQIIDSLDKKIMLWSLNTYDWIEKNKDNIVNNVIHNIRPGEVVLMHSFTNKRQTVEALPKIIEKLQWQGYQFARVDHMIEVKG